MPQQISIKRFVFLLVLVLLLFPACHNKRIERNISVNSEGIEDFDSFIKYYNDDSLFQLSRTIPPYITRYVYMPLDASGTIIDTLYTSDNIQDWSPWHLEENYQIQRVSKDTIYAVIDNSNESPIYFNYVFVLKDKKWFFKTLYIRGIEP